MRFAVAGGGVAGLAAALAVARARAHAPWSWSAIACRRRTARTRRSRSPAAGSRTSCSRTRSCRAGGASCASWRRTCSTALADAGAEEQDLACKLRGPREAGDEDLVYLWVRRPLIEWALRRAAAAEPGVELRGGCTVSGLAVDDEGCAVGLRVDGGDDVRADVVVDALGRYRAPERLAARVGARDGLRRDLLQPLLPRSPTRRRAPRDPGCSTRAATSATWASTRFAATTARSR